MGLGASFRFAVVGTHMHKMFLSKAQGVSRLLVAAETRVHSQSSLCEICGERSGAGTDFPPNTYSSLFPFFFFFIISCCFVFSSFLLFLLYFPPFLFFRSFRSSFILSFALWPFVPSLFRLSSIFILFFFPSFSRLCNCQHFHTQVGSLTEVQVHSA